MFSLECMLFGLFVSVHRCTSVSLQQSHACASFTNTSNCKGFTIDCSEDVIMITNILFGRHRYQGNHNDCPACLDQNQNNLVNTSDGSHDVFMNIILQNCSSKHQCSFWPSNRAVYVTSIHYKCILGHTVMDICDADSEALNIGDNRQLLLQRSHQSGACSCVINGSTKITVHDFVTIFDNVNGMTDIYSTTVLRLDKYEYSSTSGHNTIFSTIVHVNVSNIILIFDKYVQRLWLRMNITENGTDISCTNLTTTTQYTPTYTTNGIILTTPSSTQPTVTEPGVTSASTGLTNTIYTSTEVIQETTATPLSQSTSTYTSEYRNKTSETTSEGSSTILYVVSGTSTLVVIVLVIIVIIFVRHRRENRLLKSAHAAANKPKRGRATESSVQAGVENEFACQTVAHIPHITKGSVKYAVAVPPGMYNYAFTHYKNHASQKDRSKTEQFGSSKSDVEIAKDEESICHSYFLLRPLNEHGIKATADGHCAYERDIRGADGDSLNITDKLMHVYNHITFGRRAAEEEKGDKGVICPDEYSHISIDDTNVSTKGRYYNIVNIQRAGPEPADNYCHIRPNNSDCHAHAPSDDYNHVVL